MTPPRIEELTIPPWQAFQAIVGQPWPLFLDSALGHPTLGRYSYVTADPFAVLRSHGTRIEWVRRSSWLPPTGSNPFRVLSDALRAFRSKTVAGLPPFQGGAAGLFGYDLCHHLERLPRPPFNDFRTPDLAVAFYDWVYAFDHVAKRGWLFSSGHPETDHAQRLQRATYRLRRALQQLQGNGVEQEPAARVEYQPGSIPLPSGSHRLPFMQEVYSNFQREDFLKAIRRSIEYVHAGDCFQVNIAQRLLAPVRESPLQIYRKLRERNAATFASYFDLGDFVIASASPERFLRVDSSGEVETRPIKGTRPRGSTPEEDSRNCCELKRSAKDRAENVMIVDLLRNDLGRVSACGSIAVSELCQVESYETVHHLVSVVTARLREGKGAIDLLQAAFPGGSITGAPKIRAMEIIAELEPTARGPYCGSMGFLGFDGAMDSSILIRTFVAGKGWLQFPVGSGIVADSDPMNEYEETLHKATGMLRALS